MEKMKIGLSQINTTVGDVKGNTAKIISCQKKAEETGCNLVIYPELAVTGYPLRDLVEKKTLVDDNLRALESIASVCRNSAAVVGFVDRNRNDVGKAVFNAAALLADGQVMQIYHKTLLPSYDVFDEERYFEPGNSQLIFERGGLRFGVTICEDMWINQASLERQLYRTNPLDRLRDASLDFLINISASPFSLNKEEVRKSIATKLAGNSSFGVIYLNLVGGNDELIFDGGSFVMNRDGEIIARAESFAEDLVVFDSVSGRGPIRQLFQEDEARLASALILGLRDYVAKCGFEKVVIGLSGGIDSAATAHLSVEALGPENVIGVLMTSSYTSRESIEDAKALAKNLGIRTLDIPITDIFEHTIRALKASFSGTQRDATEENIQARIRGNLLMAISNKFGYLVVNTGNKSELAMGYCTLYGDMTGGLSVLGDVPKTMVYSLCYYLNKDKKIIPDRIFDKAPSAELRPGQKDEDSLPPYDILDPILKMYIEENLDPERIMASGFPAPLINEIIDRVDHNEYKRRQSPPVLRVTSKAFGMGRRFPIAQKYRHKRIQK